MEEKYTVQELKEYFQKRRRISNHVFDSFLGDVSIIFALRMMAEEYWSGSSKNSLFNFSEHRYLAKVNKGALPLEWENAKIVLNQENDSSPITLIVYIASLCINEVINIANAPRKILSRERDSTPIGMARQLDTHCMRWLMRQPGRDFVEKAGVKQRVLSVIRKENYDILENRVYKDFLIKTQSLAQVYISNYKEKHGNSEVFKSVEYYAKICEKALSIPEMEYISGVYTLPKPNYVLLQNNLYSKIWKLYCRVMKLSSLIENLWNRKDELRATINMLQEDCKDYSLDCENLKYHNQIWINDLDGKMCFLESYVYKKDRLNDEILRKRRLFKESIPFVRDGVAVIDLSGHYTLGDRLVSDCTLHTNARPRVDDRLYPMPYGGTEKGSIKEVFYDGFDNEKAKDFFSYVIGEYKTRYGKIDKYIIIIPDDWNVYKQESIFHSISNVPRNSIQLLWSSVAIALGYRDSILSQIKSECSLATIDYRVDGRRFVSELRYIRDGGKLIPQRGCYHSENCSRHQFIDDKCNFLDTDIVKKSKVICFGGIVPETLNDYLSSLCHEAPTECNGSLIYKQKESKKIFIVNKSGYYCEREGVLTFANKQDKETLYFDELESMWIVGQRNEKIVYEAIVEQCDKFRGGSTQVTNVPKELISIPVGSREVDFLFYIGSEIKNDTRLHHYNEKLSVTGNIINVPIACTVTVSPGQGLAITELKSDMFDAPLILDYFSHMKESNMTIDSLENGIKRSYPPTVAIVEPYPEEFYAAGFKLSKPLNYAKNFCDLALNDPKIKLSKFRYCFAEAKSIKNFKIIPLCRSLDRYNIFGTIKGEHVRPFFLKEEGERKLIEILANKYDVGEDGSLNLLAWMYLGENKRTIKIVSDIVDGYSIKDGLNTLKTTLLANALCQKGFKKLEVSVLKTFVDRFRKGEANNNDYRLIYNLFQFDENIFLSSSKKWSSLNINPYDIIRYIQRDLMKLRVDKRTICYKNVLYILLFFLRIRESNVDFLRSEDWYKNHRYDVSVLTDEITLYNSLTDELQNKDIEKMDRQAQNFAKIILDYVWGDGTIEGLVTISDAIT